MTTDILLKDVIYQFKHSLFEEFCEPGYYGLTNFLAFDCDYEYIHPLDDNRIGNAKWAFRVFCEDYYPEFVPEDPNVYFVPGYEPKWFECIAIFSTKCEELKRDFSKQFWYNMILENLGLKIFTDSYLKNPPLNAIDPYDEITEIIRIFNLKEYRPNGNGGGAFPCKKKDARGVSYREKDLWMQFNHWLIENEKYLDELLEEFD